MLKNVNGKRGFWCEVSPLKSLNKTPGTDEGVEVMPRILRQDFLLLQGKGCCTPAIPCPPLRGPFAVSSHAGLQSSTGRQGAFSYREIAATGTPRAPLTPARPPSRTRPRRRPRTSRVRSTCSHGRRAHAQPANQRCLTAVAFYRMPRAQKDFTYIILKPLH